MQTLLTTSSIIMTEAKIIVISSWYLRETFSFCKWMFTFIIYFYLILSPWWSWVSHGSWNCRYAVSIRNWETGNSLVIQWLRLVLSLTRARVQSLIGELRSYKPWLAKKKKKEREREREKLHKRKWWHPCVYFLLIIWAFYYSLLQFESSLFLVKSKKHHIWKATFN